MRKNQRYNKEEMYLAVELWQESGLSQGKFCEREKLSLPTFGYWLRKYRADKESLTTKNSPETFIPVEVPFSELKGPTFLSSGKIEVSFPNGVRLSCPAGIDIAQLKTLINF